MKLLLDENISHRVLAPLQRIFPGSSHVTVLELSRANDKSVWTFAQANDFNIVTKDDDFKALLRTFGHPPRLIWLRMGNCRNDAIRDALIGNYQNLKSAFELPEIGMVEIG